MVFFILIAGAVFLFWRHEHSQRAFARQATTNVDGSATDINAAVAASLAKPRSAPQSLVISQQSPSDFPRPVHDIFEAQIALARRAISPGSIDGSMGSQTREAITVFQETQNLPVTGDLDDETRSNLTLDAPILTSYVVTTNDLDSLQPLGATWLAKSQQTSLAYETELELLAEKSHSSPTLIQKLNPDVIWDNIVAGEVLKIPNVNYPDPDSKAAFVVIHLSDRYL
jgi:peptidoglycan hydrolase-like protein with peptidoglycan-binding domain